MLKMKLPHLSKRNYIVLGGSILLISALTLAATIGLDRPDPVTLPNQTLIHIRLDQAVTTERNRPGDRFDAVVSEPIVFADRTVVPEGAPVSGVIIDSHRGGRLMGRARLQLALQTVTVNGKTYEIRTASRTRVSSSHKKRNLVLIGGGAGGGALIGALAGGGKGVLIGGPVGAGVGTVAALATGRKDVRLPPETPLTFTLAEPVTIDAKS